MTVIFTVAITFMCIVIVATTYLVTRKNVKKHKTELEFGKHFKFMSETEFSEEV